MTSPHAQSAKVAVYWDFENLHAVLTDQHSGQDFYREHRMSVQAPVVDVSAVLDYAASLGDVIIHRAYANWQFFSRYRDALNGAGIDLIQMFPRGANMKNSADIRMALDALSDLHAHPYLTHVVVVSSDSDFISLAQKVKQAGKFIAGVGVEKNSNRFWIASCNEFKFYSALVKLNETSSDVPAAPPVAAPAAPVADVATAIVPAAAMAATAAADEPPLLSLEAAREMLTKALTQLVDRQGENHVYKGEVKKLLKRLMPEFDEKALGCGSFTAFLKKSPDIVRIVDEDGGGHVAMVRPPD